MLDLPLLRFIVTMMEPNGVLCTVWPHYKLPLRSSRQTSLDRTESDSCNGIRSESILRILDFERTVRSNAKPWSPFKSNRLCQADNTSFGQSITGLSSVPINARRRRDVDDTSILTILDHKVRCCSSYELEGSSVM